ncbi:hypothetical protein TrLO_g5341 [Triparma laevis f. longispina]|uniref:Uncharacterized protein n=1 Tax=Triparma laevis f. longispina TaxID=1714387 RepID=A0A9W7KYV6_9STRA|nr:hypothetical protein TrLO_g5341 [Triparma laevis f. longispina]
MMTGILSTINPGTFSQLVASQLMNVLYGFLLCQTNLYNDNRDNSIAVLSTLRIVVFFIASMLMKGERFHRGGLRLRNHGSFTHRQSSTHHRTVLAWAYYQKDVMSTSANSMASGALTGRKK